VCNVDWTAAGTWALAIIAFFSFWLQFYFSKKQLKDARESFERALTTQRDVSKNETGTRLYLQFLDRWDGSPVRGRRAALARALLDNVSDEELGEDICNFFEDLGALYRTDRIDEYLTYETFSYFAKGWWFASKPYIYRLREAKGDQSLFTNFETLAERMLELEAAQRKIDKRQLEAEWTGKEFLEEELAP
jgi:hypothetical protein